MGLVSLSNFFHYNILPSKGILFLAMNAIYLAALAQGANNGGHPTKSVGFSSKAVYAAWNFEAGRNIPKNYAEYPEFLPNLEGWDFRINLPHTKFQEIGTNRGTATTMVGIVEGSSDYTTGTLQEFGHDNNAIWMFRNERVSGNTELRYKIIPSRWNTTTNSSTLQNVATLTGNWKTVGRPPSLRWLFDKPAVVSVGEGLGNVALYIFARAESGEVFVTSKTIQSATDESWTESWTGLNVRSLSELSVSRANDGMLAIAWRDQPSEKIALALYDIGNQNLSDPIMTEHKARGAPQIVWDGRSIHLFYVRKRTPLLRHNWVPDPNLFEFGEETNVNPLLAVRSDHFKAITFNTRLHLILHQDDGQVGPSRVFYTSSRTGFGSKPIWNSIGNTGLSTLFRPAITSLNENLFVLAINGQGKLTSSRKDPNKRGNDLTGGVFSDQWLEPGQIIDGANKLGFHSLDVLSFNGDIYATGNNNPFHPQNNRSSCYLQNFSRAFVKKFLREKVKTDLVVGSAQGNSGRRPIRDSNGNAVNRFFSEDELPMIGDFNGDGRDDIINFKQKREVDVGAAPVYVALTSGGQFEGHNRWHSFFSLKGEIPRVGDFNGDGMDDIVTFTQKEQKFSNGSVIGPAVVWVALSDGQKFGQSRVWHKFFSLKGEIPHVGDFNGDGKDDIVTFTQKEQKFADGSVIGPAVVWVSLSNGIGFETSRIWHTFFSLKGEIPMVGDFNGDGKDDIASFVQKRQLFSDGSVLGNAPVWVSLSNGAKFSTSNVWHTFFSPKTEVPAIGDFNQDGLDDIVTFVNDTGSDPKRKNNVYVAFSERNRFSRSVTATHLFGGRDEIMMAGSFSGKLLNSNQNLDPEVREDRFYDLIGFLKNSGQVDVMQPLFNFPKPIGAPHESYKWFTDKGLGALMFPDWIWDTPCLTEDHKFVLLGAAGSGVKAFTQSSARSGGRQGHIVEELGHSLFAGCLRENADPFDLFQLTYSEPIDQGGLDANAMFDCNSQNPLLLRSCSGDNVMFYDCRDPEHYFIGILKTYRIRGGTFREVISNEPDPVRKNMLSAQYNWIKDNWYDGVEFKGNNNDGCFAPLGFQCLQGQCN